MKLAYFGDLVGRGGREALIARLPALRRELGLDFVLVNGENAAQGFGITGKICDELLAAGADCVVLGNHAWDQKEILLYIDGQPRLLRPRNYPPQTPGRGEGIYALADGRKVLVVQVMGRVFMDALDCPFQSVDQALAKTRLGREAQAILVDIHAEATSEKMALGHYCDGRASAVMGTHSHVPTADAQILPGGTAYQTDIGMCGDYNSVIGMDKAEPLNRFIRKIPAGRFTPAAGEPTLCGTVIETDDTSGLAKSIRPLRLGGRLIEQT
ncbi:MAG: YmdB family metallophosphoesterase [Alphaproteobacteria bacterium]|nr:YmdB family metallophosphoesterase [Alphaproteobacteria bacterium]